MPIHGDRLNKPTYAILRSLGGGNVGEAWVGYHEVFGRQVVQKRYSTLGLEDAVACDEPRLLREIVHPHVADVLEAQFDPEINHAITFVMPYYDGGSLADAFDERQSFSIGASIKLAMQILDGLGHVHRRHGYVHRDVKPGNIFLNAQRTHAYVGDWGSAAALPAEGVVQGIHGSLLYMAPEGGPDNGEVGVTGDVYSAGLVLFELLNGPFPYAEISPAVTERRVAEGRRALPDGGFAVWDPCVPNDLRTAVRTAVRRDPAERFQSCSEFRSRLGRIRCIDWIRIVGTGSELDGQWEGSWPPGARDTQRRRYRVVSRVLRSGDRSLEAHELLPGSAWRRFGVPDARVAADDRRAVERFFADVATRAAQRLPAR